MYTQYNPKFKMKVKMTLQQTADNYTAFLC
jgi:hypothetical protein